MITYIMGYAKPEEILKYIYNHTFMRYMTQQQLTVIILVYRLVFSNFYRKATIMLIF